MSAIQGLRPHLDGPFAFFGHSLGALLAFELARQLERKGGPSPVHLFVSGHAAPQIPDDRPPTYNLPQEAFIDKLRAFGGTPDEVLAHDELMELLLPMLRADFQLSETYIYAAGEPLSCPITALGGVRDPYVTRDDLAAWCEQTESDFAVRMFPGDHFYLNSNGRELIGVIAQELLKHLGADAV
jgi:surfactin synthase thioesterase subunit